MDDNLKQLENIQNDVEALQSDLDQLVITLLIVVDRRVRRASEDLQSLYHVLDWEQIMAISEELDAANLTAELLAPKLERAHDIRDLTRLLKLLIPGSDAGLQKELHQLKIATLHLKNMVLLGVLLDLVEQLKEIDRLERKFAI